MSGRSSNPNIPSFSPPSADWGEKVLLELANMEARINSRLDDQGTRLEGVEAAVEKVEGAVDLLGTRVWDANEAANDAQLTAAKNQSHTEQLELRMQLSRGMIGGAGGGITVLGAFELAKVAISLLMGH